mgnify:CR=1 FL=1
MPQNFDVVIIGAGPAGLTAAIRLADKGASVLVADSSDRPGGQLVKQIHKFFGSAQVCAGVRGIRLAEQYYQEAMDKGVHFSLDSAVYDIEALPAEGYLVYADHKDGTRAFSARVVVMAMGASENAIAFPGWTLPGVITAGAAQTLVNLERVRCGKRVLMVGAGNVGLIVSYQLRQAGIDVAAVIEASPRVGGYEVHANKIRRLGIPILTGYTIKEAVGGDHVEGAVIARVDAKYNVIEGTEQHLDVDTVCLAVGLSPIVKLAQISGCDTGVLPGRSEVLVQHSSHMETSRPGIFVAGDAGGVEEASIAIEEGAIAGLEAAVYLGFTREEDVLEAIKAHNQRIQAIRMKGETFVTGFELGPYLKYDKPRVLIECCQEIPCNPCEQSCPVKAIHIGSPMTNRPQPDLDACIGCGKCVATCPGQACFLINYHASETEAEISIPYEFLPPLKKGDLVIALDKQGQDVCMAEVTKVLSSPAYDHTSVVTLCIPKEHVGVVRACRRNAV